jgi:hypothetical protein
MAIDTGCFFSAVPQRIHPDFRYPLVASSVADSIQIPLDAEINLRPVLPIKETPFAVPPLIVKSAAYA